LDLVKLGAAFFSRLAYDGLERGLVGLDPAARDAPSAVLDVADQDPVVDPGKDERGKGAQGRPKRSRKELQLLSSIWANGKLLQ